MISVGTLRSVTRHYSRATRFTHRLMHGDHVWHLYVIEVENRDAMIERLRDRGIGVGIHYPLPLHLQPAYLHRRYAFGDFPVTESVASRILSLPMYPGLTDAQVDEVVAAILGVSHPLAAA